MTRLLLALVAASALPAVAQTVRAPSSAPAEPVKAEKPDYACPCSDLHFKPLTEKAKAAAAYWEARRHAKVSRGVSGVFAAFGLIFQSGGTVNEAARSYDKALSELRAARQAAEAAGAVRVVGEDLEETELEFLLVKGVDYTSRR